LASDACFFSPTPRSRSTGIAARSRNVIGVVEAIDLKLARSEEFVVCVRISAERSSEIPTQTGTEDYSTPKRKG
jgi:hypothetical protein